MAARKDPDMMKSRRLFARGDRDSITGKILARSDHRLTTKMGAKGAARLIPKVIFLDEWNS